MTGTLRARSRAWRLLGDLYLEGVTRETLPLLRGLPGLGETLPDPFDLDEAAAEHHRLFGLEVFPWASVFLERAPVLGGSVTESVGRSFTRAGIPVPGAVGGAPEAPDHIGHELRLLAVLTERDDRAGVADLLGGHLMWWLPLFVHSAGRHASPFWRAVLDLTLEAALDQAAGLSRPDRGPGEPPGALALPVENPLSDDDAGLRGVARHLVTPALGGLFPALADMRALGRGRNLPGGFGRREQVMVNLLRSAAGYGELEGLLSDLVALADGQTSFFQRIPAPFRAPWTERLDALRVVLGRVTDLTPPFPAPPGPPR